MSYRIEYDGRVGKYEIRQDTDLFPWILGAIGVFLLVTLCFWPEGASKLKQLLIPGDDRTTVQAFSAMTDDLRCGAALWDAVEGFCKAVIRGK